MTEPTDAEENLHELAREEPEAVEAVAERVGGDAGEWLRRVLEEEQEAVR